MHIELAELLRCPEPHDEAFCVVSTDMMEDRVVLSGTIGCPVCRNEYEIREGVAYFTADAAMPQMDTNPVQMEPPTVQALLGLTGPGGNVVLVGTAGLLAPSLARLSEGVHFVACNAPGSVHGSGRVSVLQAVGMIPLRTSSMRGVVLGPEMVHDPWMDEAVRVMLRGTRYVAFSEVRCPPGVKQLAASNGVVVGEKS